VTAPTDDHKSVPTATDSGAYGAPEGAYPPPPETKTGHGFTIGSVVSAIVAVVILPIVFGPLGIVLGFVGHGRGERYGKWAGLFAIVCTVAGFVLGAVVTKHMRS
jgi:hypothetical protein